jgi:hypothetical protein
MYSAQDRNGHWEKYWCSFHTFPLVIGRIVGVICILRYIFQWLEGRQKFLSLLLGVSASVKRGWWKESKKDRRKKYFKNQKIIIWKRRASAVLKWQVGITEWKYVSFQTVKYMLYQITWTNKKQIKETTTTINSRGDKWLWFSNRKLEKNTEIKSGNSMTTMLWELWNSQILPNDASFFVWNSKSATIKCAFVFAFE